MPWVIYYKYLFDLFIQVMELRGEALQGTWTLSPCHKPRSYGLHHSTTIGGDEELSLMVMEVATVYTPFGLSKINLASS